MNNGDVTDYTQIFGEHRTTVSVAGVFRAVYGWMFLGLLISGLVAWFAAQSGLFLPRPGMRGPGMLFYGCFFAEIALVWILSATVRKLPIFVAILMFLGYAVLNGLTLSVVFLAYRLPEIGRTFLITAGMFGGLALYGTVTRSDLSKIGAFCGMALWGLILVCVINLFFPLSKGIDWLVSVAGIVIFTGLTMWDAQKIKLMASDPELISQPGVAARLSIIGALELYLDFINLFLMLLRFFGGGRGRD